MHRKRKNSWVRFFINCKPPDPDKPGKNCLTQRRKGAELKAESKRHNITAGFKKLNRHSFFENPFYYWLSVHREKVLVLLHKTQLVTA